MTGLLTILLSFYPSSPSRAGACCVPGHLELWAQTVFAFYQEMLLTQLWIETVFFEENVQPAMMMMAEQLSAIAMQQTSMIGMFLDAKHQLETQRLFQQLQAEAHKDYHPSEGMCTIGTNVRSLAASERYAEYNAHAISARTMQRQLLSGEVLSREGVSSDIKSRLDQFINVYCSPADNNNGLDLLCGDQERSGPDRINKDVDYTRTVEAPLSLNVDFSVDNEDDTIDTLDEEDIFALSANLYGHETLPFFKDTWLSDENTIREEGDNLYLDIRSVAAKRSVAENSFAAIAGMKSAGAPEVQPFLYAVMEELGLPEEEVIELMGERPSYFAQMEVMTKKLYQNPNFYTDLYDKPANVDRKGAALQAIGLMQDRDIYRSLLRAEAILSVMLEMKLIEEQERVNSEISSLVEGAPQDE